MTSSLIAGLRSVALDVPDVSVAEAFYTKVWHLDVAARDAGGVYLRGSGADHHLLSLHPLHKPGAERAEIRHVSLRARSADAVRSVADAAVAAGGAVLGPIDAIADPARGIGLTVRDAAGRRFQVVHGDRLHADAREAADRPLRLAHVVLNSRSVAAAQPFFEQALGFGLVDRTKIMAFLNCNADHHSIALGDADNDALNHIAFLMPDIESVMRGGGRMRDAGYGIEWGPGRHGPGNNAFNYFVGPFGVVIEYTAEVQQIDASYPVGQPDDWTWPPGRVDRWGISQPPSARLKEAQKAIFFAGAAPQALSPTPTD
jgi:catechol 2,3-dioxygenase